MTEKTHTIFFGSSKLVLPIIEMLKNNYDLKIVITTDHGTVHVHEPTKILGDKNVNTNLRYKQGKALEYNYKEVFEIKNPADAYLPKQHPSSRFVFAKEDRFFAYPNNFNHYVNYYKNTFQHGALRSKNISLKCFSIFYFPTVMLT